LVGGRGQDAIDGGEGSDFASFEDARRPVTADIAAGFAEGSGSDTIVGIEGLIGSAFSDYLRGDASANTLLGAAGDDVLEGRAGDDDLWGGEGADALDGGEGSDSCREAEFTTDCEQME
jgi:Ca2+-binding RTX toxin-like protein